MYIYKYIYIYIYMRNVCPSSWRVEKNMKRLLAKVACCVPPDFSPLLFPHSTPQGEKFETTTVEGCHAR